MGVPAPQPFPFERWPRLRREQQRLQRRIARALPWDGAGRARDAAESLLGCRLRASPGAAEWLSAAQAADLLRAQPLVLWLSHASSARELPVLCALPPELAARLVDRVLGGEGRSAHPIGEPIDALSSGVLAYLAARMIAACDSELRVVSVLQQHERAAALLGEQPLLAVPFELELASAPADRLTVLACAAAVTGLAQARASRSPELPRALRRLDIALCAHAAELTLTRAELAALAPYDVVVPERCGLARSATGFAGTATLHVIGGRRARFHCAASGAQLAIETIEHDARSAMSDAKRTETQALPVAAESSALQLAGDAPVELCLELARFHLPLEELSALRPGEVLLTGAAIGERVALSAGGRTFARGELCEVDGEVGVRITEIAT